MADTTIAAKVFQADPDNLNVQSGGSINIDTGGTFKRNGVSLGSSIGGSYTVIAADDTANTKVIATGLTTITTATVQIIRSGKVVSSDPAVSFSAGNLTVSDGSTYVLTTNDVINWTAYGVA